MNLETSKKPIKLAKKLIFYQLVFVILAGFLVPVNQILAITTIPLQISNITITQTDNTATITWRINRPAFGKVEYGIHTNDYNWTVNTNQKKDIQAITISGLFPETDYFFRITADDEISEVISFEQRFETLEQGNNKKPDISGVQAIYLTGNTATIQWFTNENATSEVEYGLTTAYGSTRSDGRKVKIHDITISGLVDGTTYQFRVKSKDNDNNVSIWYNMSFRTKLGNATDLDDLIIYNIEPSGENFININETTAVISWRTNKLAEGLIRYGETPSYRNTIYSNPPRDFTQEITLISLKPGTTYYFEVEAKDVFGKIVRSNGYSFVTKSSGNGFVAGESYFNTGTTGGQVLGVSTQGLLVYLPFDEGTGNYAFDKSFNGNDGTLSPGNTPSWIDGEFGSALSFTRNSQSVTVPENDTLRLLNTLSLLAWIKIDAFGNYNKIVSKEDSYELILGPSAGVLRMGLYPQGASDWIWINSPSKPLVKGVWHFVAGTYDGTTLIIYVDGINVGETGKIVDPNNSTYPIHIGGNVADNREWFKGLIDEVAIFDYALTQDEINNIYINGVASYLNSAGISTVDNTSVTQITQGQILGVKTPAPTPVQPVYACNPNLGYTRMTALYKTTNSPDIWAILETGQKHYITSPAAFNKYECDWSRIRIVSQATLDSYNSATLVRTPQDPVIYHLFQRPERQWLRINIPSPTIFITYPNNFWGNVARIDALDINSYPDVTLIKAIDRPEVYLIEGRLKRHIKTEAAFEQFGYDWSDVVEINEIHLDSYEDGLVID